MRQRTSKALVPSSGVASGTTRVTWMVNFSSGTLRVANWPVLKRLGVDHVDIAFIDPYDRYQLFKRCYLEHRLAQLHHTAHLVVPIPRKHDAVHRGADRGLVDLVLQQLDARAGLLNRRLGLLGFGLLIFGDGLDSFVGCPFKLAGGFFELEL